MCLFRFRKTHRAFALAFPVPDCQDHEGDDEERDDDRGSQSAIGDGVTLGRFLQGADEITNRRAWSGAFRGRTWQTCQRRSIIISICRAIGTRGLVSSITWRRTATGGTSSKTSSAASKAHCISSSGAAKNRGTVIAACANSSSAVPRGDWPHACDVVASLGINITREVGAASSKYELATVSRTRRHDRLYHPTDDGIEALGTLCTAIGRDTVRSAAGSHIARKHGGGQRATVCCALESRCAQHRSGSKGSARITLVSICSRSVAAVA